MRLAAKGRFSWGLVCPWVASVGPKSIPVGKRLKKKNNFSHPLKVTEALLNSTVASFIFNYLTQSFQLKTRNLYRYYTWQESLYNF